jgi:hypothetical protein
MIVPYWFYSFFILFGGVAWNYNINVEELKFVSLTTIFLVLNYVYILF